MMMIMMMIIIIIIKSNSSIFCCHNCHSLFEMQLFIYQEYKMANSVCSKNKNPAGVVHYVFKRCISSMRQNLYGSP